MAYCLAATWALCWAGLKVVSSDAWMAACLDAHLVEYLVALKVDKKAVTKVSSMAELTVGLWVAMMAGEKASHSVACLVGKTAAYLGA